MLKIFEITHESDEKEWCTGATNIEALANYVSQTGCDLFEMDGADITELPIDKWDKYIVKDDDGDYTFKEWMEKYGSTSPDIICGTMYDI